ncbi:hypothetical protein PR048_028320 [Dryococelus australis]|uniref:Uncharacterized protein n=1 Tax=Dryococelus australis TaxID=614101 RepID=A0ABQ9GIW1_9NEOP|nr:hypothetical protein PR048_028320 [Dryococelus australis]
MNKGGGGKWENPEANRIQFPAGSPPDVRVWTSFRTMPLVGGFSRGSPVGPTLSFRHSSILPSFTLISSQDLSCINRKANLGNKRDQSRQKLAFSLFMSWDDARETWKQFHQASVPAVTCGVQASVPAVTCGVQASVPAVTCGVQASVPAVTCGVQASVPAVTCGVQANVPAVTCGVQASVPAVTCGVQASVPAVTCGVQANVPAVTCGVQASVPAATCGVQASVPTATCGVQASVPAVTCGVCSDIGSFCVPRGNNDPCSKQFIDDLPKGFKFRERATKVIGLHRCIIR